MLNVPSENCDGNHNGQDRAPNTVSYLKEVITILWMKAIKTSNVPVCRFGHVKSSG